MPILPCAHDRVGHSALCSSAVPARATHVPLYARAARAADGVLTTGATPCVAEALTPWSCTVPTADGLQYCRWCRTARGNRTREHSTLERGLRLGIGSDCISLYAVAALARRVERIAARVVFVALYRRSTAMEWQIDLSNSS